MVGAPSPSLVLCQSSLAVGGTEVALRPLRRDSLGPLSVKISLAASLLWFLFPESEGRVQLVVPGSYEGQQEASVGAGPVCFHCPACWEQELGILLQVVCCFLIWGRACGVFLPPSLPACS